MGEAIYCLKARFASHEAAEKALPEIKACIEEFGAAYAYWQLRRSKKPAEFWPQFAEKFPTVVAYLNRKFGDCNNSLVGWLDIAGSWTPEPEIYDDAGDTICYQAEVWHCTNWDPFAEFLKTHFGAVCVKWISDKNASLMGLVNVSETSKS